MTGDPTIGTPRLGYGPVTFLVATLHVFVVELATWLFIPYSIVFVLPVVLVYIAISAFVAWAWPSGVVGQLGRGMVIGSLSGPPVPDHLWCGVGNRPSNRPGLTRRIRPEHPHSPSGEYVQESMPCQLLSLGCRTANKANHVGAGDGAAVVALQLRPRSRATVK